MRKWSKIKRWRTTIVAGIAVGAVAIVCWKLRPADRWGKAPLASHFFQQASIEAETQALAAVRGLDRLGDVGTPFLVTLLDSPRASVAAAAESVLLDRIATVRRAKPTDDRAGESVVLATALAERVSEFRPLARSVSARLAVRLLALASEHPFSSDERERLVASCDSILAVASLPEAASALRHPPVESVLSAGGDLIGRSDGAILETQTLRRVAALRGGDHPLYPVPTTIAGPPASQSSSATHSSRHRLSGSSGPDLLPDAADPSHFRGRWRPPEEQSGRRSEAFGDLIAKANQSVGAPTAPTDRVGSPPKTIDRIRATFRSNSLRDVMWSLQDPDPTVAAAAADELLGRGLSDVELDLARRLTSPDVAQREQLVFDLPNIRGIDGRPWLFWLAEDDEADVRLRALVNLATTTDPAARRRVVDMAIRDSDLRINRLAKRLAQLADDAITR